MKSLHTNDSLDWLAISLEKQCDLEPQWQFIKTQELLQHQCRNSCSFFKKEKRNILYLFQNPQISNARNSKKTTVVGKSYYILLDKYSV